MFYVINCEYGGFRLPKDYADRKTNGFVYDCADETRRDPDLIEIVRAEDYEGDLEVVEIPDAVTDYEILEYDGMETALYVLDGKIHYAD